MPRNIMQACQACGYEVGQTFKVCSTCLGKIKVNRENHHDNVFSPKFPRNVEINKRQLEEMQSTIEFPTKEELKEIEESKKNDWR